MILSEQIVNTSEYAGTIDILTGVDEFTPQVEYNDEWHVYKLNGKIIPSVTQLLDTGEYNNGHETVTNESKVHFYDYDPIRQCERGKLLLPAQPVSGPCGH